MEDILYVKKCQKHTFCTADYPCPVTIMGENNIIVLFVTVTVLQKERRKVWYSYLFAKFCLID